MPSPLPAPATSPRRPGRPRRAGGVPANAVRERLLRAAIAQFAAYGFDGAGLRQIAAEVDVDASMVVHHFGGKLQLWQAAIDSHSHEMLAALDTLRDAPTPITSEARLDQAIGTVVDMLCDRPELAAFILREVVLDTARSDYSYERLARPVHDALAPIIADCIGPDAAATVDIDTLFVALMGAIVTSITARGLLGRLRAGAPDDEAAFRATLKNTVSAGMAVRTRAAPNNQEEVS